MLTTILVVGGLAFLIFIIVDSQKTRALEEAKIQKAQEDMKRNEWIFATYRSLSDEFSAKYLNFLRLGDKYFTSEKEELIYNEQRAFTLRAKEETAAGLEAEFESYRKLIRELDLYLSDPDKYFEKKFYDFLDDSVLTDPVKLAINHPEAGPVVVKVNRKNAEKYTNPSYGTKYFPMDSRRAASHRYLVSANNNSVVYNHYSSYYDDGFGILDYIILYNLFCNNENGFVNDVGFVGGQGGAFGGGGASADYFVATEIAQPSEGNVMQDVGIIDSVTEPAIMVEVASAQSTDPIIADPFAEENQHVEQAQPDSFESGVADLPSSNSVDETTSVMSEPPEAQDLSGTSY